MTGDPLLLLVPRGRTLPEDEAGWEQEGEGAPLE